MISIHGLIRSHNLELGRDADTGGQTKYVVELCQALSQHPEVARVDCFTRRIVDPEVSEDYACPLEQVNDRFRIVRIEAGPEGYVRKEELWDHLDSFVDNMMVFLRQQERLPDVIHSHYADAGYVGAKLAHQLGIPLVHTGHSLGRVKRNRLLASGYSPIALEQKFHMSRRVEAEEFTLSSASGIITSTHQEIEEQYELYDYYTPEKMVVIPPGTDLSRFHPPTGDEWHTSIGARVERFLAEPNRPMILAVSRPDHRKNIPALLKAYGQSKALQEKANLVVVAGIREDIKDLDEQASEVITELLLLIDRFDLYGKVAYPKTHQSHEIPDLYRLCAWTKGVFVNPALTEPFGLTLIEAAASGAPVVATEDGGPKDIIKNCQNGALVNPLDPQAIAEALLEVLSDWEQWQHRSTQGLRGVRQYYAWEAHAEHYLSFLKTLTKDQPPAHPVALNRRPQLYNDRAIFSDLDQNLLFDPKGLPEFLSILRQNRKITNFGIATGRRLDSALSVMRQHGIPEPDVLITSGGTEIYVAPKLTEDLFWTRHIEKQWTPNIIRRVLKEMPGLILQPKSHQSRFKISYYIDPHLAPSLETIRQQLHQEEQAVNVILSFGQFLDILPIRATKGLALRYIAELWSIPLHRILVAGGSGADEDMMRGNTLAAVVGNRHHEELSSLENLEHIYFAKASGPQGILEAIQHYDFFHLNRKEASS
jgi:sucrose-phosphate synthase